MIAHVIERRQAPGKSSYKRLAYYIVAAKHDEDDILWRRTAEYVLGMRETSDGEKVLRMRLTHCEAEIPVLAIAEIEATQAQNTRSKADKTYHLVISFPDGETPGREQLEDIEDAVCAGLGFAEHQRVSAIHQDTDNLHIHLAINKVHPVRLTVHEPYYPYFKLDQLCRELEIRHGLEKDNRIGQGKNRGRAGDMESFTGEQSLLSWIQEQVGERLKQVSCQGQGWADIHAVLAEYHLVIKPRGAGLVIGTQDGRLHVKASSVDCNFSFKALTDRFGPYQPPRQQALEHAQTTQEGLSSSDGRNYQRGPRQAQPGAGSLWMQYQAERERMNQERAIALSRLKEEQWQVRQRVFDELAERRASVKANPSLAVKTKRGLYQELAVERASHLARLKAQEVQQREIIRQQYPRAGWDDWLTRQASQGNVEALAVLRGRQQVRQRLATALLTAENVEEAKTLIHAHLKPSVRRNGDILYRLGDGGRVEDAAQAIHVPEVTEAATLLALTLADERFRDKALVVEGTTAFKVKVVEMAAVKGLNVRFAEPELEEMRVRVVKTRAIKTESSLTQSQSQGWDGQSR
jgi:hypothetical protein